jgi:hypothetical protein
MNKSTLQRNDILSLMALCFLLPTTMIARAQDTLSGISSAGGDDSIQIECQEQDNNGDCIKFKILRNGQPLTPLTYTPTMINNMRDRRWFHNPYSDSGKYYNFEEGLNTDEVPTNWIWRRFRSWSKRRVSSLRLPSSKVIASL